VSEGEQTREGRRTQVPQVELVGLDRLELHVNVLAHAVERKLDIPAGVLTRSELRVDDDAAPLPVDLAQVLLGRAFAVDKRRIDFVVAVCEEDVEHLLAPCEVVHARHLDSLPPPGHEAKRDGDVGRSGGHCVGERVE